jgi:23S rRNA G2069 N7-methylase RlmK/C1962 C5-methylase RlmI
MKFLRLHDPLLSVLFEDDEIVAIDKPYGIDVHTNDSKVGNADSIQHGLIELFEKQLKMKLHIVHRLDRTTTGVIVFAKSLEAAKKYQDYFRNRETKKTYLFITSQRSSRTQLMSDLDIVHKGANLEAKTEFSRLTRSAAFEVWQAHPLTGRNHQIRIHSANVEIPILGDVKYGGSPFPFLCLHNQRIEFPGGVTIETAPPVYFQDLALLEDAELAKVLLEVDRRLRLFSAHGDADPCFRLMQTQRDCKDRGLSLDQFGKVLSLSWYRETWLDSDQKRFSRLSGLLNKPILVRRMGSRANGPSGKPQQIFLSGTGATRGLSGIGAEWVASENRLKHELRTESGQSLGLFLDQRLQRNWVLENSKCKSVLNLFSYTCGFSVAAALGGASEVTSVDTNKNVLNWGRRNFELNGLESAGAKFFCRDSVSYLDQCRGKNLKFDLIICDPPAFSRGEKGIFKIEASLEPLLKSCLVCLNDGGDLLFSANSENIFTDDIRKIALKVQAELGLKGLEINSILSALDFELPGDRTALKSFLFRKGRAVEG